MTYLEEELLGVLRVNNLIWMLKELFNESTNIGKTYV